MQGSQAPAPSSALLAEPSGIVKSTRDCSEILHLDWTHSIPTDSATWAATCTTLSHPQGSINRAAACLGMKHNLAVPRANVTEATAPTQVPRGMLIGGQLREHCEFGERLDQSYHLAIRLLSYLSIPLPPQPVTAPGASAACTSEPREPGNAIVETDSRARICLFCSDCCSVWALVRWILTPASTHNGWTGRQAQWMDAQATVDGTNRATCHRFV